MGDSLSYLDNLLVKTISSKISTKTISSVSEHCFIDQEGTKVPPMYLCLMFVLHKILRANLGQYTKLIPNTSNDRKKTADVKPH